MKRVLTLLGLGRVLKLTPSNLGRNGLEIVEAGSGNRPTLRPFSNGGETDVSWDINGLGSGVVNIMGSEAERQGRLGAASGYCGLDAGTLVPFANLGTGTADGTKFLRDDRTWATPSAGGVSDGDKGDVTVSSSGTVWTIDNDAVTYAKMQDVSATDRLLGRSTAGAGIVEEITCTGFARQILDDADAATVRATIGAGTGSGDALTSGTLAQFASTTSLQLLGVMSDETGTGSLVFGTSPTLTTPRIAQINGVANGEISVAFFDATSAVNYFAFQSRATGGKPRLSATGSDTNVGLVLGTKGTGLLEVAPNGTSLREVVDVGASGENRTMVGKLTFPSGATNGVAIPDFTNSAHNHSNTAGGGTLDAAAIGSGTMALARLPDSGPNRYLKAGTTNFTAYYCAGLATGVGLTTKALVANRIFAVPFIAPARGGTLDELEVYVTTGVAATNLRIGIYENTSESGLYPGTLLLDAGAFTSTTSSQKRTASISQALTPGALYWFAVLSDGAPTLRGGSTNQAGHILGTASSANTTYTTHIYAAQTYGALPGTFPGSPTAATGSFPAIFCRFSA